jgi:hypothetical protein
LTGATEVQALCFGHMKTFLTLLSLAGTGFAGVLWTADPAKPFADVFKIKNIEGSGTITAETDPEFGPMWRFYKPGGSNRTEAHGAKGIDSKEGDLIYIGWTSKVTMPHDMRMTGIFQFKSYPPGNGANYPLLLRPNEGSLILESYDANKHATTAWSVPLETDKWFSVVIGIMESKDPAKGWIEVWYNGVPQPLKSGSTRMPARTLDGGYTDPKWGVYHAFNNQGANLTNLVRGLRIGTDYASVDQNGTSAIRTRFQKRIASENKADALKFLKDMLGRELPPLSRPARGAYFLAPSPSP